MPLEARPFTRLAGVYDAIMADIEYDGWAEFVLETLAARGWTPSRGARLLDLACGTGSSALPYLERGFQVTGADVSNEMLELARKKLPGARLVRQGFLELALPERFNLVTCVFDSLNNLTEPADLAATFARVLAHLEPGGWFAFDMNTRSGVRELWDEDRFEGVVNVPEGPVHFRWTHAYDPGSGLGFVTAYCHTPDGEFVERHAERGYDPAELAPMLESAGFADVEFLEYPDGAAPTPDSPRVWGFARRPLAAGHDETRGPS